MHVNQYTVQECCWKYSSGIELSVGPVITYFQRNNTKTNLEEMNRPF